MRIGAAIAALVALFSLAGQWVVSASAMADAFPFAVAWRMLGYLTILGNLATLVLMTRTAITGTITARAAAVVTVIMAVVGLAYHVLLAGIWQPVGFAWWADQGLHSAVPVLVVLWWVAYAPKAGLVGRDAVKWLVWPIGYSVYALARGHASGFYPYPFMDVTILGITQVLVNLAGLAVAFVVLSLLFLGVARVIR